MGELARSVSISRSRFFRFTVWMLMARGDPQAVAGQGIRVLSRSAACLVGIEACPSAHHWSRQLQVLGHTVKLMPPSYVKAYLKRSKNTLMMPPRSVRRSAAIMRFVPTKSNNSNRLDATSQPAAPCPSTNDAVNAIRGHMAELGIISAKGRNRTPSC